MLVEKIKKIKPPSKVKLFVRAGGGLLFLCSLPYFYELILAHGNWELAWQEYIKMEHDSGYRPPASSKILHMPTEGLLQSLFILVIGISMFAVLLPRVLASYRQAKEKPANEITHYDLSVAGEDSALLKIQMMNGLINTYPKAEIYFNKKHLGGMTGSESMEIVIPTGVQILHFLVPEPTLYSPLALHLEQCDDVNKKISIYQQCLEEQQINHDQPFVHSCNLGYEFFLPINMRPRETMMIQAWRCIRKHPLKKGSWWRPSVPSHQNIIKCTQQKVD